MPLFVEGVALWAPTLPGWSFARSAFRGEGEPTDSPACRPAPELLPAAERRRAPDTVALALTVAAAAIAQAGLRPSEVLSVFASAHGDLAIHDNLCRTLVDAPASISPTRFLNSVHNAPSGYWGIATGCMQASTAVSAFDCSFAVGMLEALTQCATEQRPVLLVGCDVAACGPLASTNDSRGLLAAALVLTPVRSERSLAALGWSLDSGPTDPPGLHSQAAQSLAGNAMADALPLFEALARADTGPLLMPLSARLALALRLQALA